LGKLLNQFFIIDSSLFAFNIESRKVIAVDEKNTTVLPGSVLAFFHEILGFTAC
jgi:hypothetical protein